MLCLGAANGLAQKVQDRPATDSSVQASPLQAPPPARQVDGSAIASPASGQAPRGGTSLAAGATVRVTLDHAIDSGRLRNGEIVPAKLASAVRTTSGTEIPAGSPASISVIETVPAGRLSAEGEFSLQLVRVGQVSTATDFKVYRGKPGAKDVADAAPKVGTDAGLPAGALIEFRVMGEPGPANGPPKQQPQVPGAVNGTASGGPPPKGSTNSGEPVFGGANGTNRNGNARPVQPADNTFGPAQHTGQTGSAPNQPSSPATGAAGTAPQGASTQTR